jgi:O-antigen/teichoic acid export membrane protein
MKELKLGIPLVIVTFMIEFLKSMDKLIIAKQLGFYNMGLYSMAMMANSYVFSLPMMFSHVWYPNLQEEFGRKQNAEGIKHYLLKPTLTLAILCPFFCGLAFFIIPYITYLFLPKFIPGLWPMKIYLVGTFFLLLAQFSGNFLVTLDKYFINIPVLAIAMVVNFVCNITLIRMGRGLEGVAIGTAMSFAVYGFTTYMIAMKEFASWNEVFSNLLKLSVCLILFFGGIFLIDHYLQNQNPLKDSFVKTIVFLVFSAPFFLVLEKKTGLFKSTLKSL